MIEAGMSVARRGEGEKHRTHENGYRGKRKAGAPRLNGLYCPECQTHRACYDRPKAAHKPEAAFPVHLPPLPLYTSDVGWVGQRHPVGWSVEIARLQAELDYFVVGTVIEQTLAVPVADLLTAADWPIGETERP